MPRKKQAKKRDSKKQAKKGIAPKSDDLKAKQERQLRMIVLWLLAVVIFAAGFIFIFRNASTFMYEGLKFQKINMNGLNLYKTTIQLTRPEGSFKFDLYLRTNPKDLDKIPVNTTVKLRKAGFVSFEPRLSACYGSSVAATELGTFLGALGMKVKGATTDKNYSEEKGIDLKTCDTPFSGTTVVLKSSNESYIEQKNDCYTLNIANCDMIPVAEKFILDTTLQLFKTSAEKIQLTYSQEINSSYLPSA